MCDINEFNNNLLSLEKCYYGENIEDIPIIHPVAKEVEEFIQQFWEAGEINEYVVAWKAGRILSTEKGIQKKDDNYLNGYGGVINSKELENYLEETRKKWCLLIENNNDIGDFGNVYNELSQGAPANFGTVYIINLIFFLSKTDWPIYDKYAHKAAKALYMNKKPCEVYVGDAPSKKSVRDVVNMYAEYIWYLKKLFGTQKISRTIDRALWVYGHANEKFSWETITGRLK